MSLFVLVTVRRPFWIFQRRRDFICRNDVKHESYIRRVGRSCHIFGRPVHIPSTCNYRNINSKAMILIVARQAKRMTIFAYCFSSEGSRGAYDFCSAFGKSTNARIYRQQGTKTGILYRLYFVKLYIDGALEAGVWWNG